MQNSFLFFFFILLNHPYEIIRYDIVHQGKSKLAG